MLRTLTVISFVIKWLQLFWRKKKKGWVITSLWIYHREWKTDTHQCVHRILSFLFLRICFQQYQCRNSYPLPGPLVHIEQKVISPQQGNIWGLAEEYWVKMGSLGQHHILAAVKKKLNREIYQINFCSQHNITGQKNTE